MPGQGTLVDIAQEAPGSPQADEEQEGSKYPLATVEPQEDPRTRLVTDNIGLAYKTAWHYRGKYSLDFEELKELALLGLVKAAQAYDAKKACAFSSFAITCCTNEIRYYLRSLLNQTKNDVSMNTPVGSQDEEESLLGDTIKDDEDFAEDLAMTDAVRYALTTLDDRERDIIRMRYFTEPTMSQQDVADHFGVTQSWIRKIERKALNKMRELLQS